MRTLIKHPKRDNKKALHYLSNTDLNLTKTTKSTDIELVDELGDVSTICRSLLVDTSTNYPEILTSEMVDELGDVSTIKGRRKKRIYKKVLKSAFNKIDDLTDMQLLVTRFIIESAIQNGNLISDKIKNNDFLVLLINNGFKGSALKKTMERLVLEKQLFETHNCQRGPGGYRRFKIDEEIRQAYISIYGKKRLVIKEKVDKLGDVPTIKGRQLDDENSDPNGRQLDDENSHLIDRYYLSISFIIESLENFKFTKDDYHKIFNKIKDHNIIEQSLKHLAFDIKHNVTKLKKGTTYYDLFMGIMMANGKGVFHAPKGYKSDKEIFLEQQLQRQKVENALKEQLIELKFDEWLMTLNAEQKKQILPKNMGRFKFGPQGDDAERPFLKQYFKQNVLVF